MVRKREGFKGQRVIVLPHLVVDELHAMPLTKFLFITDIGFYPAAQYHFRERPSGSKQNILIQCIAGKGWIELNQVRYEVCSDQAFIIPANVPHAYGSDNEDPWTIYWIHFTGEYASGFLKKNFSIINFRSDENSRNDRRIRLFDEIYQTLSMGFSTENLDYSSICLWYLLGTFKYIPQFERIRSIQKNDIIEKSILYMQVNIEKKINLNDIAKHCGYSVSQFSQIFKKKTSRSPIDYYNNLKIQNACQMLYFTTMNIKEIAIHFDFEDQFYFSRVFKKIMGLSPMEYRKREKG